MRNKRLEREYIRKVASLINSMVERDERLVGDFVSMINIKKQERMLRTMEMAGVGLSFVSMGIYALTKEQLPYLSAFASWTVSKAIEDFRISHAIGGMEYSDVVSSEISRRVHGAPESSFLNTLQTDGKMIVYKTIDYMAGDRQFVKKIEGLQRHINLRRQEVVEAN